MKLKRKKKPQRSFLQLCHLVRHSNPKHGLERQFHLPLLSWLCTGRGLSLPSSPRCLQGNVHPGGIYPRLQEGRSRNAGGSEPSPPRGQRLRTQCLCSLTSINRPVRSSARFQTEGLPHLLWHTSQKRREGGCECPEMSLK